MKISKIPYYMFFLGATYTAIAATNNIQGIYNNVSSDQPVLCVQKPDGSFTTWAYGQSLSPNSVSGNQYYFGAALRSGGCSTNDIYLGWLNVNTGSSTVSYTPPQGSYIQLTNYSYNGSQFNGRLSVLPIGAASSNFPQNPNPVGANLWFTGFNLSGLEFSTMLNATVIPDISANGLDANNTIQMLNQGANAIRIPVRWAYMQPNGYNNPIDSYNFGVYFNNLVVPTVKIITSHQYYAILDLHSYMHYATIGTEAAGCVDGQASCPGGQLITDPQYYVNIWNKMVSSLQSSGINTSYVMADIVNEPAVNSTDPTLTAQQVFNMEVSVIKNLETQGFKGYYLVEGYGWSGLHSWQQNGNDTVFTRANFLNAGISAATLNRVIINVHQYLDSNFSGTQNTCLTDINTTGPNGFNLDAFTNYLKTNQFKAIVTEIGAGTDQTTCSPTLSNILTYFKTNAYTATTGYGYIGWTAWSTGHGWGGYNLLITPTNWQGMLLGQFYK
jgi:endoglucanase